MPLYMFLLGISIGALIMAGITVYIDLLKENRCGGNCSQGRACTCSKTKQGE